MLASRNAIVGSPIMQCLLLKINRSGINDVQVITIQSQSQYTTRVLYTSGGYKEAPQYLDWHKD